MASNWTNTAPPGANPTPGVAGLTLSAQPGAPAGAPPKLPGSFNIDVSSPQGLAAQGAQNTQESGDFINGLGQFLFGENNGSLLGGNPLGAAVRGLSAVPGVKLLSDAAGQALGLGVGAITGAAQHIPLGWLPGGTDDTFKALPHTADWQAVNDASNSDLLGGGNQKFDYVQKFLEDAQANIDTPQGLGTLDPGLLAGPGGSVAQLVGQALGLAQLPQRLVERGLAGTAKVMSGMNRVQETLARAANGEQLSPVEQMVASKVGDGTWDEQRALDFLSSHGSGLSHDQLLEMVGNFATDPTVIASLASGGLARLAQTGVKVVESGVGATSAVERAALTAHGFASGDLGRVAKVARSIIDPLSAIGSTPAGKAAADLLVDNVAVKGFANAYGMGMVDALHTADAHGWTDEMLQAMASRGDSVALQSLADIRQATAVASGLGADLIARGGPNGDIAEELLRNAPGNMEQIVREQVQKTHVYLWDDANKAQLTKDLATTYGVDETALAKTLAKASDDHLAALHDTMYATHERDFRLAAQKGASEYKGKVPYERLNMVNESTLTHLDAQGILDEIAGVTLDSAKAAGFRSETQARAALLRDAQRRFPELKRYVIDDRDPTRALEYFKSDIEKRMASGNIMAGVTAEEMADMPKAVQDFIEAHPSRRLGFRPADEHLWNLEQDATGRYRAVGSPWVEHVFPDVTYRPGFNWPLNLAGQPILRPATKAMDWLEAGGRMLNKRISSTAIRVNAEQRFVKYAVQKLGLDKDMAQTAFTRLNEHLDVIQKPSVRSLSPDDMWTALDGLIPRSSAVGKREVLAAVLDAYEGDLRYVGLTQKFTGAMKKEIAALFGYDTNFAGQVSEDMYNMIRFKRNPLFQAQESVEPFVLNSQRGIGMRDLGKTESDTTEAALMRAYNETSVMRVVDTDIRELSAQGLAGKAVVEGLADKRNALQRLVMPNIKGVKRNAQFRGITAGSGEVVRNSFRDAGIEHEFLAFKENYAAEVGHAVSDSEAASRWLAEQASSNLDMGIDLAARPGQKLMNFDNLMAEMEAHTPTMMGELKPLALDSLARRIDSIGGVQFRNINDIQRAITTNKLSLDQVLDAVHDVGAGPEYVSRVERALTFHWGEFWDQAGKRFHMSDPEVRDMQQFVARAAQTQGMHPQEFLSQIVSYDVKGKWSKADIDANIAAGLASLRSSAKSSRKDLAKQLTNVFAGHLHPSARATLAEQFGSDLPKAINDAMTAGDTQLSQSLQKTLTGLTGGTPASGGAVRAAGTAATGWTPEASEHLANLIGERMAKGVADANPDLERVYRYFSKWAQAVMPDHEFATAVKRAIPADGGVPYNQTHAMLYDTITQRMRQLESDTYRMQYFARDRGLLERSINHPFFGIYPASYMWFKIMPELVRFVAKEPFGLRTGAMAYALTDVEKSLAIQREYDPEFGNKLDAAGNSALLWMAGYLLPATPWNIPASAPTWLRDLSGQGLKSEYEAQHGIAAKGENYWSPISHIADYVSPLRSATQTDRVATELGNILTGSPKEQAAQPGKVGVTAAIAGPVQELAAPLADAVDQLGQILSSQ